MMSEMLAANQPVMVDDTNIINVWRDNLEQAFKDIAEIVQTVRPRGSLTSALSPLFTPHACLGARGIPATGSGRDAS